MFVTMYFMAMVIIIIIWKQHLVFAGTFRLLFDSVELLYMSASYSAEVTAHSWWMDNTSQQFIFMGLWNYRTMLKHHHDFENNVSKIGMVRVPGT